MTLFRDPPPLKILLLTSHYLKVYLWYRAALSPSGQFAADEEGVGEFQSYLAESPDIPFYLVVDLAEEDFRNETVPHVLGKDRQVLHQRKLSQLFRSSEYRCAKVQGRETQGRRDDRVLFSALTSNEKLAPWIKSLLENKIPLKGVSSTPILLEFLARHMHFEHIPHLLLVTMHPPGGLRLTYLQHCQLKFSRLLALPKMVDEGLVETILAESRHTRQYLERLKLIPRDQPMETHLFVSAEECAEGDRDKTSPGDLLHTRLHDIEAIAREISIDISSETLGATLICLVHALRARYLPNAYGSKAVVRFYEMAHIRKIMNIASIALILVSLMAAAPPLITGLKHLTQAQRLSNESILLERQYQSMRQNFPSPPIPANEMKIVVETLDAIRKQSFSPMVMMTLVSQSLAGCPDIQLKALDWREEPVTLADPAPQGSGSGNRLDSACLLQAILENKTVVTTVMHGTIHPFTGYKNAHGTIARLIAALETHRGIRASAISMPVETRADTATTANLNDLTLTPKFSLKIEYRPTP